MQNELLALARPELVAMSAYRSARSEATQGEIWLDANENPWHDACYNRYPEPQPYALISHLSGLYAVKPEQLLLTRGSDEGIDLLVRLFCRAIQEQVMICPPTYGMYKIAATIQGAGVIEIPLLKQQNFALDLTTMLTVWQPSIKLIFLCSPNNPTGNLLAAADILTLCKKLAGKSIIIVDEAYVEFATHASLTSCLPAYPNLVVLRTLSKAYGLAGLRCGATIAHTSIIQLLKKIIAPYPIPQPIATMACQQISIDHVAKQLTILKQERERLFYFLSSLTLVKKVWPSEANFLLFEAMNAKVLLDTCLRNGIVLRNRSDQYNLTDCIRITIGSPDQNTLLMEVLRRV
jgi:histidinol-phosphate aminotransferase